MTPCIHHGLTTFLYLATVIPNLKRFKVRVAPFKPFCRWYYTYATVIEQLDDLVAFGYYRDRARAKKLNLTYTELETNVSALCLSLLFYF
jgi:hypothetical protein